MQWMLRTLCDCQDVILMPFMPTQRLTLLLTDSELEME